MSRKLVPLFVCVCLVFCRSEASRVFGDDLYKALEDGLLDIERETRHALETEGFNKDQTASREEIEEDNAPVRDPDASDSGEPDVSDEVSSVFGDIPDIFKAFVGQRVKAWWEGENVCVERENKEDNSTSEGVENKDLGFLVFGTAQFSSCKQTPNKYVCTTVTHKNGNTKTTTVTYQCCQGFRHVQGQTGCVKFETKPMLETIVDMGADKFAALVRSAGVEEVFEKPSRTVFAPTNSAVEDYQAGMVDVNQIETQEKQKGFETNKVEDMLGKAGEKRSLRDIVLNHIVPKTVESIDITNDMILKTEENGTLRLNIFPGTQRPLLTVNCVPVNSTDNFSDTGVIHTVDAVLTPVTRSVSEILEAPEFSDFKQMMVENEMMEEVSGEGPYTVFALDNEAMKNAPKSKCIKRILGHHVLPHTVCSAAAGSGKISAIDSASHWVRLGMDEGTLMVDETVKVTKPDILATNGIVHQVDSYAIPQSALSVMEALKKTNHTGFASLLEKAGLVEEVDSDDAMVFVPSEEAIGASQASLDAMPVQELKTVLGHHIGAASKQNRLTDGLRLKTMDGQGNLEVRITNNLLSGLAGLGPVATVNCVPLTRLSARVCNGVLYEIERIMMPPNATVFEMIQSSPMLTSLKQILKDTKLEGELKEGLGSGVTLLAPSNDALEQMGEANYDILLKDKELADQILRAHILTEPVCCSSVGVSAWPFVSRVRTLGGSNIETNRRGRRVTFAGVDALQCDTVATDGIIHLLGGVMLPAGQRHNTDIIFKKPNSEIILTGF